MIKNLHYHLQLTAGQADFLADSSYGHNRMGYLVSLARMGALKLYTRLVNDSKEIVGNLYKQVKDPNLIASMSGHVNGSKAFARYRTIDDDMKKELISLIQRWDNSTSYNAGGTIHGQVTRHRRPH